MTVNKTVEAREKYRTQTPVGQFKVRFVYSLGGVPVYGEWVPISEVIGNNGIMFATNRRHFHVASIEVEMVNQPRRKRQR
jgi:hypothetical protein